MLNLAVSDYLGITGIVLLGDSRGKCNYTTTHSADVASSPSHTLLGYIDGVDKYDQPTNDGGYDDLSILFKLCS